jgi:hypothetical protein
MASYFADRWPSQRALRSVQRARWNAAELDAARERIEFGPGGDLDAAGRPPRHDTWYVPGLKHTLHVWLRLYERVQRGEVGGHQDGLAAE